LTIFFKSRFLCDIRKKRYEFCSFLDLGKVSTAKIKRISGHFFLDERGRKKYNYWESDTLCANSRNKKNFKWSISIVMPPILELLWFL